MSIVMCIIHVAYESACYLMSEDLDGRARLLSGRAPIGGRVRMPVPYPKGGKRLQLSQKTASLPIKERQGAPLHPSRSAAERI
ncbi:hypothetical protein CDAR_289951 [Caerostris darwini]|uniref:Uncharacterized protein n=1 Tax=Caerostris darwini TaxID=1538125 RepID=A0AAV4WZ05_9ARAC|nr:hypothetical protein CDAR_289951 [Caerostris darwini]